MGKSAGKIVGAVLGGPLGVAAGAVYDKKKDKGGSVTAPVQTEGGATEEQTAVGGENPFTDGALKVKKAKVNGNGVLRGETADTLGG